VTLRSAGPPTPPGPVGPRWGLGDALAAWLAGVVAGTLALSVLLALADRRRPDAVTVAVAVCAQFGAHVAVAARAAAKGHGSLARDFGWCLRWRDARWLPVGAAGQLVSTAALWPIWRLTGERDPQQLVGVLRDASPAGFVWVALAVVVLAPAGEELVFRGLLLRSLARRMPVPAAVGVGGAAFAVVHLLDPGAVLVLAPLLGLAFAAGALAVRTGALSAPMWLHAGFNLATVVLLALTR